MKMNEIHGSQKSGDPRYIEGLMTVKEVAEWLQVKPSTVYYWSHIGFLPKVKLGPRLVRFKRSSIVNWVEKREFPGRSKLPPKVYKDYQG